MAMGFWTEEEMQAKLNEYRYGELPPIFPGPRSITGEAWPTGYPEELQKLETYYKPSLDSYYFNYERTEPGAKERATNFRNLADRIIQIVNEYRQEHNIPLIQQAALDEIIYRANPKSRTDWDKDAPGHA